jgi:hypothetical protein
MPRENIPKASLKKLEQFFSKTLGKEIQIYFLYEKLNDYSLFLFIDTNNDGLVNWTDFEAAIEVCFLD